MISKRLFSSLGIDFFPSEWIVRLQICVDEGVEEKSARESVD